jgi:hypothetical protein
VTAVTGRRENRDDGDLDVHIKEMIGSTPLASEQRGFLSVNRRPADRMVWRGLGLLDKRQG